MGVLSIVDPTQELLIQALRDIPRNPVFASIDFRANGLYPNWGSIEGQRNYVEACKKAEPLPIIPFSRQTFVFNSFNGALEPSTSERGVLHFHEENPGEIRESTLTQLIAGGRIQRITVSLSGVYSTDDSREGRAYAAFRERLLPQLVDKGYKVDILDIWLSYETHRGGCYSGPDDEKTSGLSLRRETSPRLNLQVQDTSPDKEKLRNWFRELAQEYNKIQESFNSPTK